MRRTSHFGSTLFHLVTATAAIILPTNGWSQATAASAMPVGTFVGTESERYLRVLQTLGLVRLYPWSIRGFSLREVDTLRPLSETHPWTTHPAFIAPVARADRPELVPVASMVEYNTAFPYGTNDGAIWAGRGLTAAAQAGLAVRRRPVSVVVAPLLFLAENRTFALQANGQTGNLRFADPAMPTGVDRPQRFGDGSYSRLDPGQTTARLDLGRAIAIGVSTANQWWGPMREFPFLMSNNAPGYTHVFVGSPVPWNVWIGHLHARVVYGGLAQSSYTDIVGPDRKRFASALVAVFTPRGAPGLELGLGRFFHTVYPEGGVETRDLTRPFESFLKLALPDDDPTLGPENQLASVFARWVLPRSGFEVYGEYGRDDHNGDRRDLLQEPDHIATYGLGLQKAWITRGGSIVSLGGELFNFESSTLARHRAQGSVYGHSFMRQGHTHRGQLLGAAIGVGSGAGSSMRVERFTRNGSESIGWYRLVRQERDNPDAASSRCSDSCLVVQHVLRADGQRTRGRMSIRAGLAAVYEMNREFRSDVLNVNPQVEVRWYP